MENDWWVGNAGNLAQSAARKTRRYVTKVQPNSGAGRVNGRFEGVGALTILTSLRPEKPAASF